ncbi:MAG: hypothetical protein LBV69_04350 [Bacteroidales bacterium]|jgi:hypothetical protein|nr:hypothetical protein [Bacteroidales bacterium]
MSRFKIILFISIALLAFTATISTGFLANSNYHNKKDILFQKELIIKQSKEIDSLIISLIEIQKLPTYSISVSATCELVNRAVFGKINAGEINMQPVVKDISISIEEILKEKTLDKNIKKL